MALLMLVLGTLSFELMNVDIFPAINLPVVIVVWNYPGLSAFDIERRMVFISERASSTTVNGIEHIESESINGLGILKVYFHPGTDLRRGDRADRLRSRRRILTILPRGTEPPQIISYNAANVPVAQLNIFSDTLSTSQLFDYGLNFIRIQLFTIPGLLLARAARRRAARGHGESRSDRAVRQRAVRVRRRQRAGLDQRGYPVGDRKDRQLRIRRRSQHERRPRSRISTGCRSSTSTAPRFFWATLRR